MPQVGDIWKIPYEPYAVLVLGIFYEDEKRVETLCLYKTGWSEVACWWTYDTTQIGFPKDDPECEYEKIGYLDMSELIKL